MKDFITLLILGIVGAFMLIVIVLLILSCLECSEVTKMEAAMESGYVELNDQYFRVTPVDRIINIEYREKGASNEAA